MSEVISFRLDAANPREAQAREVLRSWYAQGYSVRHILTEALLRLDEESEQETALALAELNEMLDRVGQLLEQMQNGHYTAVASATTEQSQEVLSDAFVASVQEHDEAWVEDWVIHERRQ